MSQTWDARDELAKAATPTEPKVFSIQDYRQDLIDCIESNIGTMSELPYHLIDTIYLEKIADFIRTRY
tara:strand:- start:340 stop:543 length:204 start_codon:yes stop_codon:yes gene_type:complete